MNRSCLRGSLACLALVVLPVAPILRAQTAPSPSGAVQSGAPGSGAPGSTGPVVLSPFTINSSKDVGFVAATSLAGGRLNSNLNDTPAAYSVLTSEFIDALQLTDLESAMKWTVNSNNTPDDGANTIFANQISGQNGAGYLLTFRGVSAGQQEIDFFPAFYNYDSYDIDRFDFARGPNAILFGNGSFGGTPNATMKKAQADRAFEQVKLTYGSWKNLRATADVNRPITDQLAVRINLLDQAGDTWRDREYNKRLAGAVALTYSPWAHTQITANADIGNIVSNFGLAVMGDDISGWDGKTTFSSPLTTLPSNAAALGIARNGSSTAQYPVYIPGEKGLGLVNWANSAATLGGDATAGVTPVGGVIVPGASANLSGGPVLDAYDVSQGIFNQAISGSQFRLPGREFSLAMDNPVFKEDYDNYTAAIAQQVGEHLFLNVSANYSSGADTTDYTAVRGMDNVYIDINQNLPTGVANPNYLVPYDESVRYLNRTSFVAHNYRADAAVVYDHTRFGDFRLNLEGGLQEFITPRSQYTYVIQDPTVDPRLWASTDLIRYRYYWNNNSRNESNLGSINYTNPVAGTSGTVPTGFVLDDTRPGNTSETQAHFKYVQGVLSAKLFHGKLDLLAAGRRDAYKEVTLSSLAYNGYGYGANYNGETIVYKPVAPANYFTLPTSRPTLANGFPNLTTAPFPAYQSDYSTPYVKGATNTYDIGAVYHVTDWVGVFADQSETYNPPTAAARINGGVFGPLLSKGWDAGFRFTFLDNKVVLTLTQYAARQTNVALATGTQSLPFAPPGLFNTIIGLTPLGDLNPNDQNARGVPPVVAVYSDTADAQTKGHEIELTANPLPGWRVLANYATPIATQSNAYADTRAYIAANSGALKQILADGGVVVGSNNVATVDPTVPSSSFASTTAAANAATAWNNLQTLQANFVTGAQKTLRSPNYTANLFTDYTFQTGILKHVRVGGGANYYGKEVIGFHGADTIVNPNNPAAAIPDPTANPYNPLYRGGYSVYTGELGYTMKVSHCLVRFDLKVDNLLNYSKPIYYNSAQEPPGGNLSSPARVATPYLFSYLNPRSYSLTVSVGF